MQKSQTKFWRLKPDVQKGHDTPWPGRSVPGMKGEPHSKSASVTRRINKPKKEDTAKHRSGS